jgi:hypothetical protein
MPYRRLPNSVPSVLRNLNTASDTYVNTTNPADRAISIAQFALIDKNDPASILSRLIMESSDTDIAQAAQAPLTAAVAKEAARLTMLVSHFHQVLDLGITRGTFQPGARSYYGRDVSATTLPDLSSYPDVEESAKSVVSGEAKRQQAEGANFVAMALPSAAEVAQELAIFTAARTASQKAQVNTDQQSAELQTVYALAQPLAVDIDDTVEFFYRADKNTGDGGAFRTKCSRWGVVYVYEPHEPQPAPAATTPPATPPGHA